MIARFVTCTAAPGGLFGYDLIGRLVGLSVIISYKGGQFQFHALIAALVVLKLNLHSYKYLGSLSAFNISLFPSLVELPSRM